MKKKKMDEDFKKRKNEEFDDEDEEYKKSKLDFSENDEEDALLWLQNLGAKEILNEKLFNQEWINESKKIFSSAKPFPFIFVEDMFDEEFLEKLLEELIQEEMNIRSNDMYDFYQTDDLKGSKRPLINKMREVFYGEEFRKSLGEISGIELHKYTEEVSMSAAIYDKSHKLLCHDDQLEGRRIAYVIYLVDKKWEESDGGTLDFFDTKDQVFASTKIAHSQVPKWNSVIFFEVSEKSFHQVSEVFSDHSRVSISGWFHGAPVKREKRPLDLPLAISPPIELEDGQDLLKKWINPFYLKANKNLQKSFGEESSLQLQKFLDEKMYNSLHEELKKFEGWEEEGPPNKKYFFKLENTTLPLASSFLSLIRSTAFSNLLSMITSMELNGSFCNFKKFSHKCYSLLYDDNVECKNEALDVKLIFFFF